MVAIRLPYRAHMSCKEGIESELDVVAEDTQETRATMLADPGELYLFPNGMGRQALKQNKYEL